MGNLLDAVREEFTSRLQSQTNWGKNQVIALYTEVQLQVLSDRVSNEEILNPNTPKETPIMDRADALKLANQGSIRHRYWLDSGIWCPSLLDVPDKYKSKEDAAFDKGIREARKPKQEGYYNPRGTQSYDTNESPDAENPFKDDKDINKGSL